MADAATRAKRFADVLAGYEAEGPDSTVPGAAKRDEQPARYAVVTESTRGWGYFVNYATTLENVRECAAANLDEGWEPVCYFDLDELAGDEELPGEVGYQGEEWMVHGREWVNGEPTDRWVLKKTPKDRRRRTYDWVTVDPAEVDLYGWEDERMPKRYKVAGVRVDVAFNTRPEPAT
jgi:hypothetical protein